MTAVSSRSRGVSQRATAAWMKLSTCSSAYRKARRKSSERVSK